MAGGFSGLLTTTVMAPGEWAKHSTFHTFYWLMMLFIHIHPPHPLSLSLFQNPFLLLLSVTLSVNLLHIILYVSFNFHVSSLFGIKLFLFQSQILVGTYTQYVYLWVPLFLSVTVWSDWAIFERSFHQIFLQIFGDFWAFLKKRQF